MNQVLMPWAQPGDTAFQTFGPQGPGTSYSALAPVSAGAQTEATNLHSLRQDPEPTPQ